ncbi:phage tail tape measure protein, partial [Kingella kingae]|nr:phage tail tape measure protein [Kingella kingae]
ALIMSWSPLASFVAVFSSLFAWFAGLPATFAAYGGMMIDGLVNGIKAKIGAAVGAVQSLAARIKGAFTSPKSMDIHSPSRVFRSYGGYITEGLVLGVNGGAAQPLNHIGQLAGSLKERFAGRMRGFNSDLSARLSANADTLAQARSAANTQAAANHANGAITIHFNPTINAQGGNLQQIETALQMSLREFEELFKRMMADKARRAY